MNCQDVQQNLVAYLDDEVTPSERALFQRHIAQCPACQAEAAALWRTESRLRSAISRPETLNAPADARTRLEAALAARRTAAAQPSQKEPTVNRSLRTSFAAAAAMVIVVAAAALAVPPVRAAMQNWFGAVFRLPQAGGESLASAPFQPMVPAEVPDGLTSTAYRNGTAGEIRFIEMRFFNADEFLVIYEEQNSDARGLPSGEAVEVNGQPAVLETGVGGTVNLRSLDPQDGQPLSDGSGGGGGGGTGGYPGQQPESLDYADGARLTWVEGGTRVEMLTNLPAEALLAVAEGMHPAEQLTAEEVAALAPPMPVDAQAPEDIPSEPVIPAPDGAFDELLADPASLPDDFYASKGVTLVDEDGAEHSEQRYYGNERFIIITEAQAGDALPAGEAIAFAGHDAVIERSLSGTADLTGDGLSDGSTGAQSGGGGGGGGPAPEGEEPLYPDTINYNDAVRVTWVQDGVRVQMLTNVSLEEAEQVALTLEPLETMQ